MKKNHRLSVFSRAMLFISAICLAISIFVPIWKIDLDAPQYPEGLRLLIYSDKLGGNVDIINGLNHYIGMRTLHAEEFVEFTVLPYIIGFFALFGLVAAITGHKRLLQVLFALFVLFGVLAMYDFWKWEYEYGHNLDPNAAIIVPGQAYQPPLIGFKQLLNFGAYSVPALGGWLFVASGLMMLLSLLYERRRNRIPAATSTGAVLGLAFIMFGCGPGEPEAIKLNTDNCDYCRMTISDGRFGAELITGKGRVYKFDDVLCMVNYMKENKKAKESNQFICNYLNPGELIEVKKASYIKGGGISSPMGGAVAAFANPDSASAYSAKMEAEAISWDALSN